MHVVCLAKYLIRITLSFRGVPVRLLIWSDCTTCAKVEWQPEGPQKSCVALLLQQFKTSTLAELHCPLASAISVHPNFRNRLLDMSNVQVL